MGGLNDIKIIANNYLDKHWFYCRVINHQGETIELFSSVDCKGIVGNDGRLYILDLLRTFPIDINYMKCKSLQIVLITS